MKAPKSAENTKKAQKPSEALYAFNCFWMYSAPISCVDESIGYIRCCALIPNPCVVSHTPSP